MKGGGERETETETDREECMCLRGLVTQACMRQRGSLGHASVPDIVRASPCYRKLAACAS